MTLMPMLPSFTLNMLLDRAMMSKTLRLSHIRLTQMQLMASTIREDWFGLEYQLGISVRLNNFSDYLDGPLAFLTNYLT